MANIANAVPFPSELCAPTSRRYTPGELPKTTFRAQNGATSFVYFGREHVDARLELTYANIIDAQAAAIIRHYEDLIEDQFVTFEGSITNVYRGMTGDVAKPTTLRGAVEDGLKTLRWKYDGPPQITSVYPGVSTVQCRFIGYLYGV